MYRSLDIGCTCVDTCISCLASAILNFSVILVFCLLEFLQLKTWHLFLHIIYVKVVHCMLRWILISLHTKKLQTKECAGLSTRVKMHQWIECISITISFIQTQESTPTSRMGSIWRPQVESSRFPLAQSRRMLNWKVTSPQAYLLLTFWGFK